MKIKHCRFCNSNKLKPFLNLGNCQPADQFLHQPYSNSNAKKYPLEVTICESCSLVQLNFTCSGEILYQQDYPYESDVTREGREHWKKFADDIVDRFKLNKNDLVIDIGSNVGELLSNFKDNGTRVCGIDPAHNIASKAIKRGIPTIVDFFNSSIIKTIKDKKLFPKIITGTNVFAHIDDINGSVEVVKKILLPDGVFVIEAPYLKNLLQGLEYDTIYHEHLTYLSIKPLRELFQKFDLEIFDVEFKDFHGGSIRVFVQHKNSCYEISNKILEIERDEEMLNIHNINKLENFAKSVEEHKRKLIKTLKDLKRNGKKIAGVGAPAKGMTLLNFCEIDINYLEFVTEVSKLKINRYCPGTDLKIMSDEELITKKIDYALILPWNFKNEIMKNLNFFKKNGGKFIIPLPKIEII